MSISYTTSHKKFSEGKKAHVGMEALKTNQTRWESTTPQHFHTIPSYILCYFAATYTNMLVCREGLWKAVGSVVVGV